MRELISYLFEIDYSDELCEYLLDLMNGYGIGNLTLSFLDDDFMAYLALNVVKAVALDIIWGFEEYLGDYFTFDEDPNLQINLINCDHFLITALERTWIEKEDVEEVKSRIEEVNEIITNINKLR